MLRAAAGAALTPVVLLLAALVMPHAGAVRAAPAPEWASYRPAQPATRTATPRLQLPATATGTAARTATGTATPPALEGATGVPTGADVLPPPLPLEPAPGEATLDARHTAAPGEVPAGPGAEATAAIAPAALPAGAGPDSALGAVGAPLATEPAGVRPPLPVFQAVRDPGLERMWQRYGSPQAGRPVVERLTADRPGPWRLWPFYALLAAAFGATLWSVLREAGRPREGPPPGGH